LLDGAHKIHLHGKSTRKGSGGGSQKAVFNRKEID
jgi:hypothetical protein